PGFGEAPFAERSGTSKLLGSKCGVATNSVEEMERHIEAVQDTTPGDGYAFGEPTSEMLKMLRSKMKMVTSGCCKERM
ncbi:hypothetical protein, partial [Bacteroides pyogenes]|uniref:hypothetical protein n=1 Tax=Bacteroides pyogenes TaxID=310300 RepID=UPI001BAAF7C9